MSSIETSLKILKWYKWGYLSLSSTKNKTRGWEGRACITHRKSFYLSTN